MSLFIGLLFATGITCTASKFRAGTRGFAESPKVFDIAKEVPQVWESKIFGDVLFTLYASNVLYINLAEFDRIVYAVVDEDTDALEPEIQDTWVADGFEYTLECH